MLYIPENDKDEAAEGDRGMELLVQYRNSKKQYEKNILFAEIYRLYYPMVLGIIRTRVHHEQDAEDILSEVFLRLSENVNELDAGKKLGPWLSFVARNRAIDQSRSNGRKSKREVPLTKDFLVTRVDQNAAQPSEQIILAEQKSMVTRKLELLPEKFRTCIQRSFFDGQQYKEIAAAENLTLNTVKSRIHLGIKKMSANIDM